MEGNSQFEERKAEFVDHKYYVGLTKVGCTTYRTTPLHKCPVVPRQARIQDSWTFLSLNSRRESNTDAEETYHEISTQLHVPRIRLLLILPPLLLLFIPDHVGGAIAAAAAYAHLRMRVVLIPTGRRVHPLT